MTDDEDMQDMTINLTLRNSDAGEITMRQILLGHAPILLIEPEYEEETDTVVFNIDATDVEKDELIELLESLAAFLKDGVVTNQSVTTIGSPDE